MKKLIVLALALLLAVAGCKYCPFTGCGDEDGGAKKEAPAEKGK